MKKNNRAACAARFLVQYFEVVCQTTSQREIFIFEVLTTTGARSSKSFTLCLYMKTIRAKQAKVHSAYFVRRDQHGIIAKDLTQSSILLWRFPCSCRRSFLNPLIQTQTAVTGMRLNKRRTKTGFFWTDLTFRMSRCV